jgi:hypothetical protein
LVLADGTRYEGGFKNGTLHGQGVWQGDGGRRYEGEYKAGVFHGKGMYTFASGDRCAGTWREGRIQGEGQGWIASLEQEGICFADDGNIRFKAASK